MDPYYYSNNFFVFLSVKTQFETIVIYVLPHCDGKVLNDAYYDILSHKAMSK